MGKYQQNIENARRVGVIDFLQTCRPGELIRVTDKHCLWIVLHQQILCFFFNAICRKNRNKVF